MTNDYDHRFVKWLIGWEMIVSPTSFYTRSPQIKVIMDEHVNKWVRKWHAIFHVHKRACRNCKMFSGHLKVTAREPIKVISMSKWKGWPYHNSKKIDKPKSKIYYYYYFHLEIDFHWIRYIMVQVHFTLWHMIKLFKCDVNFSRPWSSNHLPSWPQ